MANLDRIWLILCHLRAQNGRRAAACSSIAIPLLTVSARIDHRSARRRSRVAAMRQEDRLGAILAILADHGSVGVVETAARLDTSQATIRRDLQALEEQGLVKRTHGGAIPAGVLYELPMRYRGARQQEEKGKIAELAAGLIDESAASV